MMKKLTTRVSALALAAMLVLGSLLTAFAASPASVDDSASIFSADQKSEITSRFDRTGDKTGWQLILYTGTKGVSSGLSNYYNQNYVDRISHDGDAVVLVFDIASNKGAVISHGSAESYISDERLSEMGSMLRGYLDKKDYYGGALAFADKLDQFYADGVPKDGSYSNVKTNEKADNKLLYVLSHYGWIFGIIAVAAGVIFFAVNSYRYKNLGKSGTYDLHANSKVDLNEVQDDFITQNTTVRVIRSESSGGGSSGGDGGSSHGGGDF